MYNGGSMSKSVKKNFAWQFLIEVLNMLIPLLTSPIIARSLGAEGIGIYSYVFVIVNYFALTASLGMFQYGTREIASNRDDNKQLSKSFSELFLLQLIIGIGVLIVYIIYVFLFARYKKLFVIEIAMLFGTSILQISWLYSGLENFKFLSLKNLVVRFISLISIILFIKSPSDIYLYTLIVSMESLIGAIILLILLIPNKELFTKVKIKDALTHLRGVFLLFIPILATYLYASMDKIMLGNFSTMSQLGFYENSEKALITKNLATAVSIVLVPKMANLMKNDDKDTFNKLLFQSIELVLIFTIAFGVGTASISDVFSVAFWGSSFIKCSPLIKIMSFTIPAYGLTYVVNNQLLMPLKKENIYVFSTVVGVILNFILNYLFIPKYDALGAACATLITQYFVLILECFIAKKYYDFIPCLLKSSIYWLFSFVMYIVVRFLIVFMQYKPISLFISIPVGGLTFVFQCIIYWSLIGKDEYLNYLYNALKIFRRKKNEKNIDCY